nr:hypothetical protein [Clostridia bacterium]
MKKMLAALLAVLLISVTAGCSEKTLLDPDHPVALSFWHVYGEQADAPMNKLVAEFNSTVGLEKGIAVSVTNVSSTAKIGEQLLSAMNNEPGALSMPDIFSAHIA